MITNTFLVNLCLLNVMKSNKQEDFDDFVSQLQASIDAKDREDFSEHSLELAEKPYKYGSLLVDAENIVSHTYRGPCGDAITLFLKIKDGKIMDLRYQTDGCTTSKIAGSQMSILVDGKSLKEAKSLTQQDVLDALGKFPEENHHCALLAVETLKQTIEKYQKQR